MILKELGFQALMNEWLWLGHVFWGFSFAIGALLVLYPRTWDCFCTCGWLFFSFLFVKMNRYDTQLVYPWWKEKEENNDEYRIYCLSPSLFPTTHYARPFFARTGTLCKRCVGFAWKRPPNRYSKYSHGSWMPPASGFCPIWCPRNVAYVWDRCKLLKICDRSVSL